MMKAHFISWNEKASFYSCKNECVKNLRSSCFECPYCRFAFETSGPCHQACAYEGSLPPKTSFKFYIEVLHRTVVYKFFTEKTRTEIEQIEFRKTELKLHNQNGIKNMTHTFCFPLFFLA